MATPEKKRDWSALAPIMAFAGLAFLLAVGLTRDPRLLPSEMIDREMPSFDLPALRAGDARVSNADLEGQISLVNVFGSWCAACIVEHSKLVELSFRNDIQMVGLNWRDNNSAALRWLAQYGDPYDLIAIDTNSNLAIELGVTGAPETFLIGPNGQIRYKQIGPLTDQAWSENIEPIVNAIKAEAN